MQSVTKKQLREFEEDAAKQMDADAAVAFGTVVVQAVGQLDDRAFRALLKTLIAKRVIDARVANEGDKFSVSVERYCRKMEFVIDAIDMTKGDGL